MTKLVYKQLLHYYVLWIRSSEQVWNRQCLLGIWRRQWHPTPVLLPGKSHGQKSQVGCSPWGHEESDTTEWLHFHFSLSCTGEGNGNPLQCSCLETPRDGGAWWAAIYGVTQSRTRLKQLSSSSTKVKNKVKLSRMKYNILPLGYNTINCTNMLTECTFSNVYLKIFFPQAKFKSIQWKYYCFFFQKSNIFIIKKVNFLIIWITLPIYTMD